MMRGKCLAAVGFALVLILGAQSAPSESTASGTAAAVPITHVSAIDAAKACSDATKAELGDAIGTVSLFDVEFFASEETQSSLKEVGTVVGGAPPDFPAAEACSTVYKSDTTGCDACCGRLWAGWVRWCDDQPDCQACKDEARAWKRQCQQGCVDVATWPYPEVCADTHPNSHSKCWNCCVDAMNDMYRWCQLAYPNDPDKRRECEAGADTWIPSCLGACP